MSGIEILKYSAFGYSFLVGIISFSLSDDLRNPRIFKKCLIAGIISFAIGIFLELSNTLNLERGMTLLLMSVSLIYLGNYLILRKLFRVWKGTDPVITSSSSKIGGIPIGGFWTSYPKNRKIILADFLFSMAQTLIPIFIIMVLILLSTKS